MRLSQTIGDLTCVYLEILVVVIRLGVTGLRKTRFVCLLDLFGQRGRRGVSGAPLDDWANVGCVDVLV